MQQEVWPTEDYTLARSLVTTRLPENDLFAGITGITEWAGSVRPDARPALSVESQESQESQEFMESGAVGSA